MHLLNAIHSFYRQRQLTVIISCAAFLRFIAAMYSKGYAMHDDHFCVIEIAQRWVEGYGDWLGRGDSLRSIVYPGLHYLLFRLLEALEIFNPQIKMTVVRLLHAAYSLLTVYFGYRISQQLTDRASASRTGWLLAAFWLLPMLSVRNLIEFVCIPPLMAATWLLYRADSNERLLPNIAGGICFGIAFAFRFQTLVMAAAVLLYFLAVRKWRRTVAVGCGVVAAAFCIQGISDWLAYGYPFASTVEYVKYNSASARSYVVGQWYQYLLLLMGIFIPPVSLLLLYGWVASWKKIALLFWPSCAYLVFHSVYPGKQERFILPILPFIIIAGVAGWRQSRLGERLSLARPRLMNGLWIWFWAINTVFLAICTPSYVKKARCETLIRIWSRHDCRAVIIEGRDADITQTPRFYLGLDVPVYYFPSSKSVAALQSEIDSIGVVPNYAVCIGTDRIKERIERLRSLSLTIVEECTVSPGVIDALLHRINPRYNINYTSHVFRLPPSSCD